MRTGSPADKAGMPTLSPAPPTTGWETTRGRPPQTIFDPAHVSAAQILRQQRFTLVQPATETEVEQRRLVDYDTALGVAGFEGSLRAGSA